MLVEMEMFHWGMMHAYSILHITSDFNILNINLIKEGIGWMPSCHISKLFFGKIGNLQRRNCSYSINVFSWSKKRSSAFRILSCTKQAKRKFGAHTSLTDIRWQTMWWTQPSQGEIFTAPFECTSRKSNQMVICWRSIFRCITNIQFS